MLLSFTFLSNRSNPKPAPLFFCSLTHVRNGGAGRCSRRR
jgi:hypothetical protein